MASTSHNRTSPPPTRWDVFLSFRGDDTRYSFTAHLYRALCRAGIKTFMDSPELRTGEVISDSLIQAIQNSNTHIVVLSENYASSSWCLGELEEILACYKRMKRLVIPVFYHIDPAVVRHQSGGFKEAFEKHQTRFDLVKVNKWRLTLKEVADFSGFHVYKTKSEADVINEVIDKISPKINPKTLYVAKFPVGLDSRIKDVTALLNSDTEGVIRIGIHGMGGVGKTTLAKAVYNKNYQRFQGSCFLANVREVSARENGIESLQHQLIVDVLECNNFNIGSRDQGIELIRARIRSTKVLLVIDDLDNRTALEYLEGSFALGSVIVITTRNEDLLDLIKVQTKYSAKELNDEESRQLFAQHAFEDNKIPCTFAEMSKEILQRAGGLPLALQVFGSSLLGKREEEWKQFINKLSRVPFDDIEKKLMISFDALKSEDPMLQEIFLDIACFHIGNLKEEVVEELEAYHTFVNLNIDFLIRRCLLTINDYGGLWMHDLLRDMGRRITQNNCPDEPGKHSRLWVAEDVKTVLKNNKGTEKIKDIRSRNFDYYNLSGLEVDAESFKRMSNLRSLCLNKVNITGSFEKAFENLKWLSWMSCPLQYLPSEFYPQKLVTLELEFSKMKTIWERNMVPGVWENLKTLNMHRSSNLTTTPDFTRLPRLESLDLSWCESLKKVHVSIGSLVSLVSLNLEFCKNLRSLPDSICSLRALKVLNIHSCKSLKALPTELGNIVSLKVLNASNLGVSKLPYSIGRLGNLVELNLHGNKNLETLPDIICKLRSLQILDIEFCKKLEELPDQLWKITSLRDLHVSGLTKLKEIPDIVELPPNLKSIRAHRCTSLKRLPNLSHLKQLENLGLNGCSGLTEIKGLEELTSLKYLELKGCNSSLVESTLTIPFLQILSAFGHTIQIKIQNGSFEFQESGVVFGSTMSFDLQSSASDKLKGIIFCFSLSVQCHVPLIVLYSLGDEWSGEVDVWDYTSESLIIIVPCLPLGDQLIEDGHNKLEVGIDYSRSRKSDLCELSCGIQLLYETKIKMISWYNSDNDSESNNSDNDSESNNSDNEKGERIKPSEHNLERTTVNVEDERSKPSDNDLESNKKWLTLGSSSTNVNVEESNNSDNEKGERIKPSEHTVNVEDERSKPSDNDLESNKWLPLGSSSTNVNVEEGRSPPSKRWECDSNWLSL